MSADQVAELDSFHCVFGEVVSGFDVLDAIEQIPQYVQPFKPFELRTKI